MSIDLKKGGFRKKKNKFTQVSNEALRDTNLSLKAKGLYALIQSYLTIENFTLYKSTLKSVCVEGEKAFESTWKELKDAGYLVQYRLQDPETKTFYYEYDLLDESDTELATEVHASQNRKTKNEKAIPPKREVMDNRYDGKGGEYNNTYINNTYSMYVGMYEKHLISSKEVKDFIANNYNKISLDLFEKILIETMNNNRVSKKDSYFVKTLKALIKNNIETIKQYEMYIEEYKSNKNKSTNKSINNTSKSVKPVKTRLHTVNETFRKYDEDELEKMLFENQKGKFK